MRARSLALSLSLIGALGACTSVSPRPPALRTDPPGLGRCVPVALADGRTICLSSAPLSGAAPASGVEVESLVDPSEVDPLPPSVDLRGTYAACLEVRDQSECGWCAGHAAATTLDALICAEGCPPDRVSLPHLWSVGRGGPIGDCGPGMMLSTALGAATETPLVSETDWAFTGGARGMIDTRPSDSALDAEGRYRALDAVVILDAPPGTAPSASQLQQIRRALASGRPVAVTSGLCWHDGWSGGHGVIDAPHGPCGHPGYMGAAGSYDGYHAYVLVGYDDATGEYIAQNSWGTRWGQGGYVRLTRAFVETQISGAGYLTRLDEGAAMCEMPAPASCESITDCARCAATTGCLSCDGRCVAANATRTAPADGQACTTLANDREECPAPASACSTHTTCDACAQAEGCGWCGRRDACVAWPADARTCIGERVATAAEQCNDADYRCEAQSSCDACQALTGCGWCGDEVNNLHGTSTSRCVGGSTALSDRSSCSTDAWHGPGAMCPAPPVTAPPDAGGSDAGMCSPAGETCTTDTCCGSLVCRGGGCCALVGSPCASPSDCCDDTMCVDGTCACIPEGGACTDTILCCGSNVCHGGTCGPP